MPVWEGYVDWRNKPAIKGRHGGMLAASFVLGKYCLATVFMFLSFSNNNVDLSNWKPRNLLATYTSFNCILFDHFSPSQNFPYCFWCA